MIGFMLFLDVSVTELLNLLVLSYTIGLIRFLYELLEKGVGHGSIKYILNLRYEHICLVKEEDNSGVT